jgi:hypothetical protein
MENTKKIGEKILLPLPNVCIFNIIQNGVAVPVVSMIIV